MIERIKLQAGFRYLIASDWKRISIQRLSGRAQESWKSTLFLKLIAIVCVFLGAILIKSTKIFGASLFSNTQRRIAVMSMLGKCHNLLFLFVTLFMSEHTGVYAHEISIEVLFNSVEFHQSNTTAFLEKSFEKILSVLGLGHDEVNFVYKDLNSTFCDLGTFLFLVERVLPHCEFVVLLLEDCKCEKTLELYLDILNMKVVSRCEEPFFTAGGTSEVLQRVSEDRQHYLFVPADAHGVQYYKDLSSQLQRKKLKLSRTLWFGPKSDEENELKIEFRNIAQNIDNNIMSGASFLVGFPNPNDLRIKKLLNIARTTLGKQFGKILWILPVVNLDLNNMLYFPNDSEVLSFQESIPRADYENSALKLVLEKTFHILENCWKKEESCVMGQNRTTRRHDRRCSFSTKQQVQECHSCAIDVLQLITDHHVARSWKRIATWNGIILQPCSSQGKPNNLVLTRNDQIIFRVPIVEYFPYIVKHEFLSNYYTNCPVSSLPCYGQRRKADNSTVINYADKYCCTGWTVDVLTYLTSKLSYEFELYFQAENVYGVYDNNTGTWNGVIQDLLSGKGDIAVDLSIYPDRCIALDCSLGYLFDGFNAITKLVGSEKDNAEKDSFRELVGNFQIFLSPFHLDLLITVLMIFNIFLFLIWATDKICLSYRNKRRGMKKEKFTLLESTSYVWATAFGRDVGDSKKPLTLSARYLSSWLAFLSLIFVNVYVARLMAEIVKHDPTKPFTSLRDPEVLNKNLKLGVVRSSSMEAYFHTTRDPVLKKSFENIKENLMPNLDAGVEAVKNGILDGFIADTVSLVAILNRDPNCSLSLMGQDFSTLPVGFIFRKNWPWAEEFKLQELDMNDNKEDADLWKLRRSFPSCEAPSVAHAQLRVADMSGLFLILIFAIAYCSCISLVLENITSYLGYRYRKSNVHWNVPHNHRDNVTTTTNTSFNTCENM